MIEGLQEFLDDLERLNEDTRREILIWLDALGFQFLEEVQKEIVRVGSVDTRRLLTSFNKGDSDNVWILNDGALSLEIGTNVEYATWVNDGHKKTKDGVAQRWVPGVWGADGFEYQKDAKTGMLLKAGWVEGSHYFDTANRVFEAIFARSLDKKLEQWLQNYGR